MNTTPCPLLRRFPQRAVSSFWTNAQQAFCLAWLPLGENRFPACSTVPPHRCSGISTSRSKERLSGWYECPFRRSSPSSLHDFGHAARSLLRVVPIPLDSAPAEYGERRALWPRPTDSCCRPSPGAAVSTSRWRLWRCNSRCHLGMSIVTTLCIRMSLIQRLTSLLAGICLQSRKSRSSFHQGSRTRTSLARSACLSCLCRPLSYRTPLNILRRPNSMTSIDLLLTSSTLSLSLAAPRFNRARHPSAEAAAPSKATD